MNYLTRRMLIEWVDQVTRMLVYQGNIFPHSDIKTLVSLTETLLEVLKEER